MIVHNKIPNMLAIIKKNNYLQIKAIEHENVPGNFKCLHTDYKKKLRWGHNFARNKVICKEQE